MKKLSCKNLGGACDTIISGETFDQMGQNCRNHVMEKINAGDEPHIAAMNKMKNATAEQQQTMMAEFEKKFNSAPDTAD
ncbi:MAG: DUF1059 domain-containing protein [Alphaproteobacteria bacterium]